MSQDTDMLVTMYRDLRSSVKKNDEILEAASDTATAGRRAYINTLIKDQEGNIKDAMNQILSGLSESPDTEKYGFYFGLVRSLRTEFDEKGTAFADEQVKNQPKIEISTEEVEKASAERSAQASQMKYLYEILKMLVPEEVIEELGKPPRKRTTGGPRGKRAISYYSWTVDGKEFSGTFNELAKELGYEKSVVLRNEMKDGGINLTKPPALIEFTTSGGVSLVGTKAADAPNWEEDSDSDAEEDDDDEDEDEDEENGEE